MKRSIADNSVIARACSACFISAFSFLARCDASCGGVTRDSVLVRVFGSGCRGACSQLRNIYGGSLLCKLIRDMASPCLSSATKTLQIILNDIYSGSSVLDWMGVMVTGSIWLRSR